MKKIIACVFFAFISVFVGCSSENSTSADATNKDFHVTFKYAAALDGNTGEISNYMIVANLDFEFQGNNKVKYCPYVDGNGGCEILAYTLEVDKDGDEHYQMSRKGGNVYVEFCPKAVDAEGPTLLTMDYDKKIIVVWSKTDGDLKKSIKVLQELLTKTDN